MNISQIIKAAFMKLQAEGHDTRSAFNQIFAGVMTWEEFAGNLHDELRAGA